MSNPAMAAPLPHTSEKGEFARGWPTLVASFLGIGFGMSTMFMFTAGIFAGAIQKDLGWSRSQFMGAAVFDTIAVLTTGLLFGRLIDKIGARPVVIASCVMLGLTTMALSLTSSSILVFYAIYAFRSLFSVGTMPPAFAKVVSAYFTERRGLALGIVLSATGVAGVILPQFVQFMISHYGWRAAYVGLGALPLILALPSILLFLPGKTGAQGAVVTAPPAPALEGVSIGEALRNHRYWVMAVVALIAGLGLGGILGNLVPMLIDRGFSPAAAAAQLSLYGLVIVVGRLVAGWLLDRHWAPGVGSVFLAAPAIGALVLWSGADSVGVVSAAVIFVAMASGAEFDLMAFLTAKYFGRRNFTALYSGQNALFAAGAGSSPALFGMVRDSTHSYTAALLPAAVLFAVASGIILLLGRYPSFGPNFDEAR